MTKKQTFLYWREWSAVREVQPEADRHALHVAALGRDKSHKDFTNQDFDKVLAGFRAISRPADLDAQLRQADQSRRRIITSIRELERELGEAEGYAEAIARRMSSERHFPTFSLDVLHAEDLQKLLIALKLARQRR